MPYREVRIMDVHEVVRRWLAGDGIRSIARATGLDRKTIRPFLIAARDLGLRPGDSCPEESRIHDLIERARRP